MSRNTTLCPADSVDDAELRIATVLCNNDCGGRCHLKAHVRGGKILRITNDDFPDLEKRPQLRGCLKGRSLATFFKNPRRLTYPLKRVGRRGEGKFERICWDEGIELIATKLKSVLQTWGPDAVYIQYATGQEGVMNGASWARRLMNLLGGHLAYYGTYSSACLAYTAPFITGYRDTNSYQTLVRSKLIILNGFNPAETIFETNSNYYLAKAKEAGAKIIVIDPRLSETAATFADEWIPLKPTTDAALFAAMAHVIVSDQLQDQEFLDRYCVGFDGAHMPDGIPATESYKDYLLGVSDGIPKSPEWASPITGVAAETIRRIAREYATSKPAQLIQGLGPQRHATGEQSVRAGITLACVTGNLGKVGGGWGGGEGARNLTLPIKGIPTGENRVKASIPVFLWTDAIVRGTEMSSADGVTRGPLESNIKFIFNLASNTLLNQHADINHTSKILADESLCEFIVASDHFLTPSVKFADLVLPGDHSFERNDLGLPWSGEKYFIFGNKVLEPPPECKNEYWWLSRVAERLGIGEQFTETKTYDQWLEQILAEAHSKDPSIPSFGEMREVGLFRKDPEEYTAFAREIEDPVGHPFPTPSGKIEIFSRALYERTDPAVPAIPAYVAAPEGPEDALASRFPLQCVGPHTRKRIHSIFDSNEWLEEADPHRMSINAEDARARKLHDGDRVKVFNHRGALYIRISVTNRIRPGVVSIPEGGWYTPDEEGHCQRGSINVLTSQRSSPLAHGSAQHTLRVEVVKARGSGDV
jgi:DmsA/YnfE family anaerobic dimethyl sulfoxide reductase A subunit